MAGNWLGGESIAQGWGQPPNLTAGDLGSLVSSILRNKLGQQELTQKTLSEAIKAEQVRRQASAYGQALSNAGLTEGQDVSGLSQEQSTRLAQLLQERTPDTEHDALLAAQTKEANAKAALYGKYGTGSGEDDDSDEPEDTWKNGVHYRKSYHSNGTWNWIPVRGETGDKPQTQADLKNELANIGVTGEDIRTQSRQHGFLPSGQPVPANQPWTNASRIDITPDAGGADVPLSIQKFRQLKKALGYPDPDPTPAPVASPGATPSAQPTPNGSPMPTAIPRTTPVPSDQAGGHAGNYGTPSGSSPGQSGQLVPNVSRSYRMGHYMVWTNQGWVIDTSDPREKG